MFIMVVINIGQWLSTQGGFALLPPGDVWQCQKTFLIVMTVVEASATGISGVRSGAEGVFIDFFLFSQIVVYSSICLHIL